MPSKDFFLDILPRIMWIFQVVMIFGVGKGIFKEQFELTGDIFVLAIAIPLIVLGVVLFGWSQYCLLRHWKRFIPTKVVREGPFRWIRHPTYVGLYAVILGSGMLLSSLAAFAISLGFLPFWIFECLFEERQMLKLFGDNYREYKANVGMFFPKMRKLRINEND